MKTARFTAVVEKTGAPETYLLWVPPKQDSVFQRALKEHRILTVHQENVGAKKDYGLVGFHEKPNAQFLVFPKSLRRFLDRRIIGINYDLLAKDSRAGKLPSVERRGSTKVATREKLKPTIKKPVTKVQSEPDENVFAFEQAVIEPTAVRAQSTDMPGATTPPRPTKASKPPKMPGPPKATKPTIAPESSSTSKPAKKPEAETTTSSDRRVDGRVLAVVRRAMKDLDAGKTVAAYKRLEALIAEVSKSAG